MVNGLHRPEEFFDRSLEAAAEAKTQPLHSRSIDQSARSESDNRKYRIDIMGTNFLMRDKATERW